MRVAGSQPIVIETGNRSSFAMRLTFLRDQEPEYVSEEEERSSWAEFAIWAGGRNITVNRQWGEEREGFRWYVLPLLEWLAQSWDPLLHEERLPDSVEEPDAAAAAAAAPPLIADLDEALDWFTRRQAWLQRHSFRGASAGGRFLELFLRRWRGLVELSWRDRLSDDDFRFGEPDGRSLHDPAELASALHGILREAARVLLERHPESIRMQELVERVSSVSSSSRTDERLAWLAGLGSSREEVIRNWEQVSRVAVSVVPRLADRAANALVDYRGDNLVVVSSRGAALLASLTPDLDPQDASALAELLDSIYQPEGPRAPLQDFVENAPIAHAPWEQGYDLAEHLHDRLATDTEQAIEIATLLQKMGVIEQNIELSDVGARGLSFATSEHRPMSAVNLGYRTNHRNEVRRFTLAQTLCHLLYDRDPFGEVALAASRWGPFDLEQRARAFAAMFLMPRRLVRRVLKGCPYEIVTVAGVRWAAKQMNTSITATLEHLHNLEVIDFVARDRLREELSF